MASPWVLLLGVVLVLIASAAGAALLRPEGPLDACITAAVAAVVLVTAAEGLIGLTGHLRADWLLAAHAVEAGAAVLLLRQRGGLRAPVWRPPRPALRRRPWQWLLLVLAATALSWQLLVALVLPPYAYDGLSYHLTTVATWVQGESLDISPLSLCCAYYPLNPELLFAWPVLLHGSDALVGTVQVLATVLAATAVAGLGRSAGVGRAGAAAGASLFVLTPAVLAQAPTPYVDVISAALVLSGLHGLVRFGITGRASGLAVPAACAGLLAGSKGTGLLWAVALVATAGVLSGLHVRRGRLSRAHAGLCLAGVLGAVAVLGSWWYVRNALDTGNPLYPFQIRAGGRTVWEGPARLSDTLTRPDAGADQPWPVAVLRSWASDLAPWRYGSYDYQQRSGGLGPLWVWLGLPLLLPFVVLLWRRRSPVLAAVVPVLAVFLVQPYRWWARFTLPLAALGVLAIVALLQSLRPGRLARGVQSVTTVLAVVGASLVLVEVDPASRSAPLPARRVLSLVGAPAVDRSLGRTFLPEYRFLEQVPDDATLVVDLEATRVRFVYPLFGRHLTRTVLPAGAAPVRSTDWVVTEHGRQLDAVLAASRPGPAFDVEGVRVWAPLP